MAPTLPTSEPRCLVAGATWSWARDFAAFPAAEGWVLTYFIVGSAWKKTKQATNDGSQYSVELTPTDTQDAKAGWYSWRAMAALGGKTYPAGSGRFEVQPNPATMAMGDQLTFNERLLAAIEGVLEGRLTDDVEEYTIGGRSLRAIPFKELRGFYVVLKHAVQVARNGGRFTTPIEIQYAGVQ